MNVADAVGRALVAAGVRQVFGVIGSGNFHLTNAMVAAGARFVAARHEGGAATMADAYTRMSGTVAALSVHQGCGLTNAMTGIAEAAKSRTSMVVVAAEATEPRSNFYVDQDALARSVGAVPLRITSAETAVAEAVAAVATAVQERRTVLLNVPLTMQSLAAAEPSTGVRSGAQAMPSGVREQVVRAEAGEQVVPPIVRKAVVPDPAGVAALAALLQRAERPVFVAGRGARGSRQALELLAERSGALLATSAVAHGLFNGNPWSLGVSGGFASPRTAELIRGADLIVGWGCALNMWTMRHGQLVAPDATVVQVDDDASALGAHREIHLGVTGDVGLTAALVLGEQRTGYRTAVPGSVRWRDVPYDDTSTTDRIDPRMLSIALDDLLPTERVVAVDSGNFMGYPSAYLSVPDENGLCFTQAFQSVGLGLATAIGAALAQPDRLPVAALGDGGALMGAAELDTVRRLGLPMLVVVYNDEAYGAEVHHFNGYPLDMVTFPPTDIAAIGRGYGFEAATVRTVTDLAVVRDWLDGPRSRPLLLDAKVVADEPSWWLEEAFRGH